MSVWSWRATSEFLILDNMSAMGSVTITLPAGLLQTRDVAFQSELAEADAAEAELADVGARASTKAAAVAEAAWELGGRVEGLLVKRLWRHLVLYVASPGARHAQHLERLCVLDSLPGADVQGHLLYARRLHGVSVVELLD